jgi:hypothetical protein
MPALVVSNAALVTLRWSYAGRAAVNVLGASVGGTTTINQALANTLDAAIKSSFTSILAGQISSQATLQSVGIRDLRTANQAEFVGVSAATPGTAVGDPLPTGNAACITLRTARAGQSFRGRCYLGGFTEAANATTATIDAATNTACVNFVTSIGTTFSGNGLTLAVVSRPAERKTVVTTVFHADGTTDVDTQSTEARTGTVTPVTSILARNVAWDTQRRRSATGSASTLFAQPVAQTWLNSEQLA